VHEVALFIEEYPEFGDSAQHCLIISANGELEEALLEPLKLPLPGSYAARLQPLDVSEKWKCDERAGSCIADRLAQRARLRAVTVRL
jgi:hypothetical protein